MTATLGLSYPFDSGAVSQYLGWPFTDFFMLGDQAYGLAADGVYLLGGNDDAGTPVTYQLDGAQTDAGMDFYKRLRFATVAGPGGDDLTVLVRFDDQDWSEAQDMGGGRWAIGSDVIGREMQFRLIGTGVLDTMGLTLTLQNLGTQQRG